MAPFICTPGQTLRLLRGSALCASIRAGCFIFFGAGRKSVQGGYMMGIHNDLIHLHGLIAEAERRLKEMKDKEQERANRDKLTYLFIFEQDFDDGKGWRPNDQYITATSPGEAFAYFGAMIDTMHLDKTIRNISYGWYFEMEGQRDRIMREWKEKQG
jgi:hypothetical protein